MSFRHRVFLALFFILCCFGFRMGIVEAAENQKQKPNVLFLFTDDQRADTIHALGNSLIQTPNLDQLVRSGFVFNNAYCLGSNSGAVCVCSRNMLLSGRTYFRWTGRYASAKKSNFPDSMKQAGYFTYHHGKKGNTAVEIHKRFDQSQYLNDQQARLLGQPGKEIVDNAIQFLKAKADKPFFMYLAFACPHDPRVADQEYMDLYQRDQIPLPENYLPLHPFNNGEQVVRDELLAGFPRSKAEVKKHLHDYYADITGLDGHIGRLLKALKASGEYENTVIVFSSDHGLAVGSHGLMGKQSLYEHSMKAPLIFSGPGIPHGQTDALVYLYDIFPTVCEMVGTEVPQGLDAASMWPVISGKKSEIRETLFTAYKDVQRSIRDDRWKLITYPQINKSQLFDLENDPAETKNLFGLSACRSHSDRLVSAMKDWQKKVGDTSPLVSDSPQDATFKAPTPEELKKLKQPRKSKKKKTKKKSS
ncbi:sulfatase-like hydrolase/transferase [uncultured Gimesia sp.]|uniref:sulfatase-like hydrolase/transferase n=1 Tax=uncultured Gimesia sp. TaxID=1678688 RepID=UPI0030D7621F|tara:strand:- start:313514 stop:314938 length:1425 start_codon:yes stop_codon:yes gene_type:complete